MAVAADVDAFRAAAGGALAGIAGQRGFLAGEGGEEGAVDASPGGEAGDGGEAGRGAGVEGEAMAGGDGGEAGEEEGQGVAFEGNEAEAGKGGEALFDVGVEGDMGGGEAAAAHAEGDEVAAEAVEGGETRLAGFFRGGLKFAAGGDDDRVEADGELGGTVAGQQAFEGAEGGGVGGDVRFEEGRVVVDGVVEVEFVVGEGAGGGEEVGEVLAPEDDGVDIFRAEVDAVAGVRETGIGDERPAGAEGVLQPAVVEARQVGAAGGGDDGFHFSGHGADLRGAGRNGG